MLIELEKMKRLIVNFGKKIIETVSRSQEVKVRGFLTQVVLKPLRA
jgi:hypothetical protein